MTIQKTCGALAAATACGLPRTAGAKLAWAALRGQEFDMRARPDGQIPNADMNLKLNLWKHIRDISRLVVTGENTVGKACRMPDKAQK